MSAGDRGWKPSGTGHACPWGDVPGGAVWQAGGSARPDTVAGHGAEVTGVSAGTQHTSPRPESTLSVLPVQPRIPPGLHAARVADAP